MRPLALTMGDPAGVGPEIALRAWAALRETGPAFVLIADPETLSAAARRLALPAPQACDSPAAATSLFADALPLLPVPLAVPAASGAPDTRNAPAVLDSIRRATDLAARGEAGGVVTCPIAKSVLYESGFGFPGHTEYVADLVKHLPEPEPRGPVMMLAGGSLRVALVSIHVPLARAIAELTQDSIIRTALVTHRALIRDFGIARPRLALAGLNPHAGEDGALGREEIEIVNPAAAALRARGIDISDALPPDTMFREDARAEYDAAICLYHDQGLIPVKALDFHGGVNVTLGLPVVRASPDHGTGFNIAGTGTARPDSLIAALRMAADMAARRAASHAA